MTAPIKLTAGALEQFGAGDVIPAANLDLIGKADKFGFPVDTAGAFYVTLSYVEATRTVTITPTGSTFDFYVAGVKYTKTGAQSIVHANLQGGHFIYYDSTGTLTTSQTFWALDQTAPVAYVFRDVTNAKGICMTETHHAGRDVWTHIRLHTVDGTQIVSGFTASGYTLATSTDAAITFGLASGVIADEDLRTTTDVLADTGPYTMLYRSGASGDWVISRGNTIPVFQAASALQYNQYTGATWQLTALSNATFTNYWVFAVPALTGSGDQIIVIPGQAVFATLALAQAESSSSLSWGTMPFAEIAPLYQVTLQFRTSYTGTSKGRIESFTRIVGTRASLTAATQTNHGALAGLTDPNVHPASSVTNTPAGNIAATDVQAAINELDTEKVATTAIIDAQHGGTGASTYAIGDIFYADSTTTLAKLAISATTYHTLRSNGTGLAPSWQAVYLTSSAATQGTLPAIRGGTGAASYAVGDVLYADTTTTLAKLAVSTNGYVMTLAAGVPTWAAASGGGLTTGDLITTSRVLSSPNYLPCNNLIYLQSSYSALYSVLGLLPDQVIGPKIANPSTLPANNSTGCAWDSSGTYLAVTNATTSPYITVYSRSGSTLTKLSDPATLPTGDGNGCAWDSSGTYLAVSHAASPYVTVYSRSGITLTKLADPATLPTGLGKGCAWDSSGLYLAVAHSTTPFVTCYQNVSYDVSTSFAVPSFNVLSPRVYTYIKT